MNKALQWIGAVVLGAVALASAGVGYLYAAYPKLPAEASAETAVTPELLERGKYLFEAGAGCADCHSQRDWSRFSGPAIPGTVGKGGMRAGRELGLPGEVHAPNITPAALGHYDADDLRRAITGGVTKDGRVLFPIMPYLDFRHLCDRDVQAIVAYVQRLEPIENQVPRSTIDFPVNLIVRTLPGAREPWACPEDAPNTVERGRYVATIGGCAHCHTQSVEGKPKPGLDFAGGHEMPLPSGGLVRSANITPDATTGIGTWTRETFIARFRAFADPKSVPPVAPGQPNTWMPWTVYAKLSDEDLSALYDYLRTIAPVQNQVTHFDVP